MSEEHIVRIHYSTEDMANLAVAIRLCEMNLGCKFAGLEDFINTAVNDYIEQHAYSQEEDDE